jgi:ribonuclease HI
VSLPPSGARPRRVTVYSDGAARGNPGPAGAGVRIEDARGKRVSEAARYLGEATNNVAEYRALILGLELARELGASEVELRADSELVIRQMTGEYRVRNVRLQELHRQAQALEQAFRSVGYVHIRREQNRAADRLANLAIDQEEALSRAEKSCKT